MDKTLINTTNSNITNELVQLTNRKTLKLEGILDIISSSENGIYIKLKDTNLSVVGSNIHINKLDIANGILEADGQFDYFKYGKVNLFKRIFK